MEKQYFNLMQFFDGYVRNYRRMNLSHLHNISMFTKREIDYFAQLGEFLGFDAFVEDSKFDKSKGRSRPMDLSWWKRDARIDDEQFLYLALHLERESLPRRDIETVEKLFSKTEDAYIPHNVVGIQYVESAERMDYLNELILQKNKVQKSNVLMVYRYHDDELDLQRVRAYCITPKGLIEERNAIFNQDQSGYCYMCFEEDFAPFQRENLCKR
ncbi:hypothetical protein [Metabacillus bambusae]|uniref:Uncharacterized protein n=1 Tax=Metabacillus bambusae TaxID=2795218 RepID=A0ABS3N5X3_9BACI|nr:hypothetical protein [Metabacillus bambusae]MBO1513560.1 hypothetical protein [Metabacillus bambusae]